MDLPADPIVRFRASSGISRSVGLDIFGWPAICSAGRLCRAAVPTSRGCQEESQGIAIAGGESRFILAAIQESPNPSFTSVAATARRRIFPVEVVGMLFTR